MPYSHKKLVTKETVGTAVKVVRAIQARSEGPHDCPVCGTSGVVVTDRSARPYMEWYHFGCSTCGLDEALNIPLPFHAPRMG